MASLTCGCGVGSSDAKCRWHASQQGAQPVVPPFHYSSTPITRNNGWGTACSKCGHPASFHGMTFCQVDAGDTNKRRCDCDGYLASPVGEAVA